MGSWGSPSPIPSHFFPSEASAGPSLLVFLLDFSSAQPLQSCSLSYTYCILGFSWFVPLKISKLLLQTSSQTFCILQVCDNSQDHPRPLILDPLPALVLRHSSGDPVWHISLKGFSPCLVGALAMRKVAHHGGKT